MDIFLIMPRRRCGEDKWAGNENVLLRIKLLHSSHFLKKKILGTKRWNSRPLLYLMTGYSSKAIDFSWAFTENP